MKRLIVSYHGLGDHILLTPVLKAFKKKYPKDHLGLTYLRRLPVPEVMAKCPYVDEWLPVSDAWNDFGSFDEGFTAVIKEARDYTIVREYDELLPVTMSPDSGITHKIFRAAHELGIEVKNYKTEIFPKINKKVRKEADKFFRFMEEPYVFIHLKTGNPPKDISREIAVQFLCEHKPHQVVEYGSKELTAHHLPLGNIPLELEILSRCSKVICADSFIMHAAGALGIPTQALFLSTPPEWVIPLHNTPLSIYVSV